MTRLALCAALFSLGCGSWETERIVTIEAPPRTVWALLADLDGYARWNSYSTRVEPERALCWHSLNGYESLARGTRCRLLEPVGENATRFRHHEIIEGPIAGLIEWIYRPRIDAGLDRMNADLKRAAEAAAK